MSSTIRILRGAGELADEAARRFAAIARESADRSGRFSVALSGGNTPGETFLRLSAEPYLSSVPWSVTHVFWADERPVPPDHPESNYRLAMNSLLSKVAVPAEQIHRMPAENPDHDRAAAAYSEEVARALDDGKSGQIAASAGSFPQLDLVLLGMGDDGHTASLFPYSRALHSDRVIAVCNHVDKLGSDRMTLTPAFLNNARNIMFLVSGANKAAPLKNALEGEYRPDEYPTQLIEPRPAVLWLVDEAAAGRLSTRQVDR